jgi:hypothetical protein
MKSITLHTAELDNSGKRREAGAVIVIGKGKDQIDADRATTLVANGGAVEEAEAAK